MDKGVGRGGFLFPRIYQEGKAKVLKSLQQGEQDLMDVSRWELADEFMAFILQSKFLEFADRTYPTPRVAHYVPVWFLLSCRVVMSLCCECSYHTLWSLLRAGPILMRVGMNIVAPLGFNNKNKYPRITPLHPDTVRKYFKDTSAKAIRRWFTTDIQRWFHTQDVFDDQGIFVLDQTHIVVPDNKNYLGAIPMPVDEFGHLYPNLSQLSDEQKKVLRYHPCYVLSTLLHLAPQQQRFHFAAYEWDSGNTDELTQARKIIDNFLGDNKQKIKLLIIDRGYISGEFISYVKLQYDVDVLLPLKTSMTQYIDAIALSKLPDAAWVTVQPKGSITSDPSRSVKACTISDIKLWDQCSVSLFTTVVNVEYSEGNDLVQRQYVLCSTKPFQSADDVVIAYAMRITTEERFRQLKLSWNVCDFSSPHASLIETHIAFTLLTFSLLQLYLTNAKLQHKAKQMISSLKNERHLDQSLVVYAQEHFGLFSPKEYLAIVTQLSQEARSKFNQDLTDSSHQL